MRSQWGKKNHHPLLLFVVTFAFKARHRRLRQLETHLLLNGHVKKLRFEEALPWNVKGTRWDVG